MKKFITLLAVAGLVLATAPSAQAEVVKSADLGSGGTVTYTFTLDDNTTATTTWTAPAGVTSIKLAVVAGGGGGGEKEGGGGGAGGLRKDASYTVVPGTTYDIQVGAGGPGTNWTSRDGHGGNSYFDSFESIGGGSGAGHGNDYGPRTGGSGGGGRNSAGGAGTAGQGNAGGTSGANIGAGGGGAGTVGGNPTGTDIWTDVAGDGGSGINLGTYFGLADPTSIGDAGYFAGGGGGGAIRGPGGSGGLGGGGNGGWGTDDFGTAGMATTGGGGGGSYRGAYPSLTQGGGSGIVILSYTPNRPPVITQVGPLAVTIQEGANATWAPADLNATDADVGDVLTWSVETNATNGVATVSGSGSNPTTFTYAPNVDFKGSDSFVVQVSDGVLNDTITVKVTVNAADNPFDNWLANLPAGQQSYDSDPDNDGIANLLEYAFGGDPSKTDQATVMPTLDTSGGFLKLTFCHLKASLDPNLKYMPEISSSLKVAWSTDGLTTRGAPEGVLQDNLPDGKPFATSDYTRVTVTADQSIVEAVTKQFLRISVIRE